MTLEEACRLIDPATDLDALAEIEYYNGFKGKDAAAKALHEASQMVVDFVRQMSWHDAKNPPIAHEESWECAGEKHCAVISDIVWVCCESGHTMKGWVENGTWHIEDGHRAVKLIEAEDLDVDVQVDGGINDETMETVLTAGANLLVAGSYVFNDDLAKNVKHARERMDEIIRRID